MIKQVNGEEFHLDNIQLIQIYFGWLIDQNDEPKEPGLYEGIDIDNATRNEKDHFKKCLIQGVIGMFEDLDIGAHIKHYTHDGWNDYFTKGRWKP